jgi:aldehyde dehydrogenase (NAD+)
MYGKTINSGQICIAPNYILCDKATQEKFIAEIEILMKEWYGDDPKKSESYSGKMVSQRHFDRLVNILDQTKGKIEIGGSRRGFKKIKTVCAKKTNKRGKAPQVSPRYFQRNF